MPGNSASRPLGAPGILLALGLVLLAGCAHLPSDAGFDQVRSEVGRRTSQTPVWKRTPEQAEAAARRVTALLAAPLTPDAAVEVALLNNPQLQADYARLGVAQAATTQAGLLRNPMLHASVLYPRDGDPAVLDYALGFDLLGLLSRAPRQRAAAGEHEQARLSAAAATLDLIGRVRGAWYALMAAREGLEWLRDMEEAAVLADAVAERLHAAGNLTDLARAPFAARRQAALLERQAGENRLLRARLALLVLLGLPPDTEPALPSRLPRLPADEPPLPDDPSMLEASLDLALVRAALVQARQEAGLGEAVGPLQELEVGYAWERDEGHWKDGPSLGLALPIFDTGAARRYGQRARVQGLESRLQATRQQVLAEAEQARTHLARARERVDFLREQWLPLHERQVEAALLAYNAMQKSAIDLLDLRRQELAGVKALVDALDDYWQARIRAELLAAGRLPGERPAGDGMNAALPQAATSGGH